MDSFTCSNFKYAFFSMLAKAKLLLVYALTITKKIVRQKSTILACKLFQTSNRNFQRDAAFLLTRKVTKPDTEKQ